MIKSPFDIRLIGIVNGYYYSVWEPGRLGVRFSDAEIVWAKGCLGARAVGRQLVNIGIFYIVYILN